jgi:hypothetical protein
MSEDFKDPNVIVGLVLAILILITVFTTIVIERF